MDIIHFVFVCLVLITTCSAEEETTVKECKNLTELEQQLAVQRREKQYLIEDDPCDGPEQKRDERQSIPIKNINPKTVNLRLHPQKVPVNIKPIIKPPGLSKPVNVRIDTTPQRIPTKIPVILKTAKVVPAPAHTMRMRMMDKDFHNTVHNKENITDSDIASKDNIPNTAENKASPTTDLRSSTNQLDEIISINKNNDTLQIDDQDIPNQDDKIVSNNKDTGKTPKQDINNNDDDDDSFSTKGKPIIEKPKTFVKPVPKPVYFFVDEPEPLPPPIKKRKPAKNDRDDEVAPEKTKDIPLIKNKKPKKDDRRYDDDIDTENDSDIIQITNGTHIISIKRIPTHDRRKIEDEFSRDGSEDYSEIEERIVNEPSPMSDEPEKVSYKHKNYDDKIKVDKEQHGCITITKHNYEEFEEKAPNPPTATVQTATLPIGSQDPWNYLQIPPNFNNPYPSIYDNCAPAQTSPTVLQIQDNANAYPYSPENNQIYFPNDINLPVYNTEHNQYITPFNTANSDIDNVLCQVPRLDALDRIWRAWKDVEIKIRNAQKLADPFIIDIRRNLADHNDGNINKGENVTGKAVNVPSFPVNVNGYLNHQNSGNNYPYVKPSYRYSR